MKFKINRRSFRNNQEPPATGAIIATAEDGDFIWIIEIESIEHLVQLANEETWGGFLIFTNHKTENSIQEIEVFDTE